MTHPHNTATRINLRVLGQLQSGDRIRGDATFLEIERRNWTTFLGRWWRQDTRDKTVLRVATLMDAAVPLLPGAADLVRGACTGLEVLMSSTYATDPLTVARLDIIVKQARASVDAHCPLPRPPPEPPTDSSAAPRRSGEAVPKLADPPDLPIETI